MLMNEKSKDKINQMNAPKLCNLRLCPSDTKCVCLLFVPVYLVLRLQRRQYGGPGGDALHDDLEVDVQLRHFVLRILFFQPTCRHVLSALAV